MKPGVNFKKELEDVNKKCGCPTTCSPPNDCTGLDIDLEKMTCWLSRDCKKAVPRYNNIWVEYSKITDARCLGERIGAEMLASPMCMH